jgi:hypothetical protein
LGSAPARNNASTPREFPQSTAHRSGATRPPSSSKPTLIEFALASSAAAALTEVTSPAHTASARDSPNDSIAFAPSIRLKWNVGGLAHPLSMRRTTAMADARFSNRGAGCCARDREAGVRPTPNTDDRSRCTDSKMHCDSLIVGRCPGAAQRHFAGVGLKLSA